MKDKTILKDNIIQFKKKNNNDDVNDLKMHDAEIIDMFARKKQIKEPKNDKKLSNQYYQNGRSLFFNGKYDKAFDNFLKAEASGCNYVDLYLFLSRCYGIKKDFNKSVSYAKKSVTSDKNCAEGYHLAIIGQVLSGKVTDETYRFAVKNAMLDDYADDLVYHFATIYFLDDKHQNFKKAKKYIMSAIDYLQCEIEQNRRDNICEKYKHERLNKYFRLKAKCCYYLNEFDDALELYKTCEKNDISNIELYYHMSVIYGMKNDFQMALEYINKAFELYNKSPNDYTQDVFEYINYLKGVALARLNDDSYLDYLSVGRNYFSQPELLDNYLSKSKEMEKYRKAIEEIIVDIANLSIDDFSEDSVHEIVMPAAKMLLDNFKHEDYIKILNYVEHNNIDNPAVIKLIKFLKNIIKEQI